MRTRPHPTRRALLAGVGAVALTVPLAACDLPGTEGTDPSTDDRTERTPEPDLDLALVQEAANGTQGALALVTATAAAHPALDARLAPLLACHRAHLEALGRSGEGTASPSPTAPPSASPDVAPRAARALRQVVSHETFHAGRLTTAAQEAESGALARLLVTMGAGVHMHLAALEEGVAP